MARQLRGKNGHRALRGREGKALMSLSLVEELFLRLSLLQGLLVPGRQASIENQKTSIIFVYYVQVNSFWLKRVQVDDIKSLLANVISNIKPCKCVS